MSLATGREKRVTAGNKMSRLLENEEEDEFYTTTYGGFNDEEEDNDFNTSDEDQDSDVLDSDFDVSEDDDVKSDEDDDSKPKRKRKGVETKAYREPVKKVKKTEEDVKDDNAEKKKHKLKRRKKPDMSSAQIYSAEKKSLRQSTTMKSIDVQMRAKDNEAKAKMLKEMAAKKNVSEVRRLTQAELLEEAKLTEAMNLKSLEDYQKLELERKKSRVVKSVYRGPIIRYHSTSMPVVEESSEINVETELEPQPVKPPVETEKCSRTFITFTDERTFDEYFPNTKPKPKVKSYCPVTRLPAKYYDPITNSPYANVQAFKIIRDAYRQQVQGNGDKKLADSLRRQRMLQAQAKANKAAAEAAKAQQADS
ncbi:unnamed protein product [Owenia fusiformis]|uniref:Vacuolar protein sorting-associated protein 72 homolog n=1 Tax=Owenia fusiformis TaxID=6347 RepID=A0A8J1TVM8_OWEFU|nr:unnamed protein product [Owenia fusiformis]